MRIPRGSLVAVVGRVGAGKSSLLSALLGDIDRVSCYEERGMVLRDLGRQFKLSTLLFNHSIAIFCYVFLCELQGPARSKQYVAIGPRAEGIPQTFYKMLGTSG